MFILWNFQFSGLKLFGDKHFGGQQCACTMGKRGTTLCLGVCNILYSIYDLVKISSYFYQIYQFYISYKNPERPNNRTCSVHVLKLYMNFLCRKLKEIGTVEFASTKFSPLFNSLILTCRAANRHL